MSYDLARALWQATLDRGLYLRMDDPLELHRIREKAAGRPLGAHETFDRDFNKPDPALLSVIRSLPWEVYSSHWFPEPAHVNVQELGEVRGRTGAEPGAGAGDEDRHAGDGLHSSSPSSQETAWRMNRA